MGGGREDALGVYIQDTKEKATRDERETGETGEMIPHFESGLEWPCLQPGLGQNEQDQEVKEREEMIVGQWIQKLSFC